MLLLFWLIFVLLFYLFLFIYVKLRKIKNKDYEI